jgi:hypothetical protein
MKWITGLPIVAIAMAWAVSSASPGATITWDDASLKFLPPETQGIAFVDVAALRDAALVRDVLDKGDVGYPRELVDFMSATGFDPMKDLDKLTIAKIGAQDALVVAQGRIDKFKLEQFFKDKGKEPEVYLGQTLYHDRNTTIGVLGTSVLIGPVNAVKKGIDQMQLPGSVPLRRDLLDAIQTIEAGNQVWCVGDFSTPDLGAIGAQGSAPLAEALKSLKAGTYEMRIDTGLHARGTARFSDEESARNISDLAKGGLAVARLRVSNEPGVLRLLDGILINSSGPAVVIKIEASGDLLKQLQDLKRAATTGQ